MTLINNGAIDYNEFVAATLDWEIVKYLKKLEMAFKYFDSNKDGYIDGKELKDALENNEVDLMKTDEFKSMLQEWGTISYGKMNYKEFLRWMSIYTSDKRIKTFLNKDEN